MLSLSPCDVGGVKSALCRIPPLPRATAGIKRGCGGGAARGEPPHRPQCCGSLGADPKSSPFRGAAAYGVPIPGYGGGGQEHVPHVSPYGWGLPWVLKGLGGRGGTTCGAGGYGAGSPSLPARCGAPQCSSRGESHQYFMELLPPGAGLRASGSGCCCCPPPQAAPSLPLAASSLLFSPPLFPPC